MKIKQIMLKNFANVNQIEINLSDSVTYLIGENGSGKTTVGLNAVWFILEGLALKGQKVLHGDRFRFIGAHGKSAVGRLILHDEIENIDITITRKLTKNKTELKITASDRRQLPANFIDDIFNIFSINPMGFAKLASQEQSVALGVDTAKYDTLKKVAYDERHEIGYDVKRLKGAMEEIGNVEPVESVDIQKLLKAKDKIEAANTKAIEEIRAERDKTIQEAVDYNQKQTDKQVAITDITRDIENTEKTIKILQNDINKLKISLGKHMNINDELLDKRSHLPTPAEKKTTNPIVKMPLTESTSEVNRQIQAAESINQQAILYQQSIEAQKKFEAAQSLHTDKQAEMDKIEDNRIEYLKSCNLPFANITIDDTGGVLINGRPFSETYFSKGEILRMGIKLAASVNPKLKYVFIPDSQSLDEKNREKLFEELTEADFQVVAEYVDTEKRKDHGSILLKESKVVESYDDSEDDLNML
jgi:DNA repair ATPase RecN